MKAARYITKLRHSKTLGNTGNKARSLFFLQKQRFLIPETYLIPGQIFDSDYSNGEVFKKLEMELAQLPAVEYAVRSSTSLEDSRDFSWAGQFTTITGISGSHTLLDAIREVLHSSREIRPGPYPGLHSRGNQGFSIVLQEMIRPVLSGVSFSRNPLTFQDEVVIEGVEGPGEDLVQKGLSPLRWRWVPDQFLEQPDNDRHDKTIRSIARDTQKLRKRYRDHIDLEWVYNGKEVYYLQIRRITVQKKMNIYSSKMASEMLPGQIKPLVWSVNIPLVNGTWIRILSEITGKLEVQPEELARAFYYRVYFNIAALESIFRKFGLSFNSLEFLLTSDSGKKPSFKPSFKSLRHTLRLLKFVHHKLHFEKIIRKEYRELQAIFSRLEKRIDDHYCPEDFTAIYRDLFREGSRLAYLNIIVPLLMQFYHYRLRKKLAKKGIDFEKIDFSRDFPEMEAYNPLPAMADIRDQLMRLSLPSGQRIKDFHQLQTTEEAADVRMAFSLFLERFGHLSESGNDLSVPKWKENPELVFRMILDMDFANKKTGSEGFYSLTEGLAGFRSIKKLYRKTGKYRLFREQVSSLYIYGYGQFRYLFLKTGEELVRRAILGSTGDIFYLSAGEISEILEQPGLSDVETTRRTIEKRKREMEETKEIVLPTVIYGDEEPVPGLENLTNYRGVGTSSGIYRGRSRVIRSTQEFHLVSEGEVLIIPFSDVSWTPVLVKAGAIVSESGGMLSHCSILARELGIPALTGVDNACAVGSGRKVCVDGSNGILTLYDHE